MLSQWPKTMRDENKVLVSMINKVCWFFEKIKSLIFFKKKLKADDWLSKYFILFLNALTIKTLYILWIKWNRS